ncbi:NADH-quinone oxidoreductase subunit L [Phycisphaerales bacterium]|nr:NADH-quinone oxidoreductase subunit L [Phycisphaerales bacterium]
MTGLILILLAACLLAASGVPGLFAPGRAGWSERVAAGAMVLAGVFGLGGALFAGVGADASMEVAWGLPWGRFEVALDPVTRAFLLPVFLVPALGSVYGLGYWKQRENPGTGRRLRLFYGLMPAAMAMILISRDGVLFLLAWEVMALSAFFLVVTEDDRPEAREAGWVYFVATHVGTLSLFAMFVVMRQATGSFSLIPIEASGASAAVSNAVFVLAAIGFGLKAGLMPLHVWLPGAHANAPSHVSAVLSGVMLNMGIYGLIRMSGLWPTPPTWWGATLLGAGAVSAVVGIAYAIGQDDVKRLLAYSSIENMGIIAIGLGLALIGRATGQSEWAALGLGGAILHAWNHSLFKPLLFFGAGSVLHGTGTRRMDQLGGLAGRMPRTAVLFVIGSVAICALPPLNGFVSELLIYLGLFRTVTGGGVQWPAAAAPALGLAGGLAAAAFAKLCGTVFLGQPRSELSMRAHESTPIMLVPMAVLAVLCVALGIYPAAGAPLIDQAVGMWWSGAGPASPSILTMAPLGWLPLTSVALLGAGVGAYMVLRRAMKPGASPRPGTWDCGYAAPTRRMQYTGSSFSQTLVSLFSWALWPRVRRTKVRGLFPGSGRYRSEVPDAVLDRTVLPGVRIAADFLGWMRLLQQGQIQVYVLYVLLTVLVLFASMYMV